MSKPIKILVAISVIPVFILLYFVPNIYGYYRFKSYCEKEGGLKVYEPLEKNVGWLSDDYDSAHMAAQLKHIGFVRYTDKKDGQIYDLKYVGNNPQIDSSFEKKAANLSLPVIYRWKNISESVNDELRLQRFGEQIWNIDNSKILVYYYMFSYERYDRSRTPLYASSKEYCFLNPAKSIDQIDGWITELNTAFKN